jgi:hypothetical protein
VLQALRGKTAMKARKVKKTKRMKASILAHPHYGSCNPCCITSGGRPAPSRPLRRWGKGIKSDELEDFWVEEAERKSKEDE